MDSVNDQLASPVGVSPFGYLRLIACLQLTEAFRSLPRPSSPASAKASIMHPFQACPPNLAGKLKSCVFSCLQFYKILNESSSSHTFFPPFPVKEHVPFVRALRSAMELESYL